MQFIENTTMIEVRFSVESCGMRLTVSSTSGMTSLKVSVLIARHWAGSAVGVCEFASDGKWLRDKQLKKVTAHDCIGISAQ
jgi:hypothetical protein